jgi:hypothetical protein
MTRIRHLLGASLVGLAAIASLSPAFAQDLPPLPADARPVTEAQALTDMLAGATLYGTFPDMGDARWSEYYCRNGKSIYLLEGEVVQGKWWIDAPKACFTYAWSESGESSCYLTYRLGDGSYRMWSEETNTDVRIDGRIAGDPFNMQRLKGMACEDVSS